MKFNQTRLIICLIMMVNIATAKLTATIPVDSLPDGCPYLGTIMMDDSSYCGSYILLDNGLKIRPNDTMLTEVNYRVQVGFEVIDSSCNGVLSVNLTCFKIINDSVCHASYTYERLRCGFGDTSSRCLGNTYSFNNTSGGNIISSLWTFSDSSQSYETNPTHSFPLAGTYNICLSIETDNGCQSATCQTLVIRDSTITCKAEIEYIPGDSIPFIFDKPDSVRGLIYYGFPAIFRDVSKNVVIERTWDFGDGTTSSEEEVLHFYSLPGLYQVCLTITTAEGCTDTECIEVLIGSSHDCQADFSYTEIETYLFCGGLCMGHTYMFQDLSGSDVTNRTWIINGDTIIDEPEPIYTFENNGLYTVCLIISTSNDCISKICKTIQVGSTGCDVDFTYNIVEPDCRGYSPAYLFSPVTSDNAIEFKWEFGDSTFSEEQFPAHYFKLCGYYSVCLTVVYDDSCEASECKSIFVPEIHEDVKISNCGHVDIDQPVLSISPEVSVYPNPTDGNINLVINSYSDQSIDIVLIDILGQVRRVYRNIELTHGENQIEIDLQELPTGNYFYSISSPEITLRGSISVVK